MEKKPATTEPLCSIRETKKRKHLVFDVFVDIGWKEDLLSHSSQPENCVMW